MPGLHAPKQRQGNVSEGGIALTLLFNEFNTIWIDLQRGGSAAYENRVKGHEEYVCGDTLAHDRAPEERPLTRGKGNRILRQGEALKAAIFLEFTIDQRANVHSNNVLDEHEVGQFTRSEMMLFYDHVLPVGASAGKNNAGKWTIWHGVATRRTHQRNL